MNHRQDVALAQGQFAAFRTWRFAPLDRDPPGAVPDERSSQACSQGGRLR